MWFRPSTGAWLWIMKWSWFLSPRSQKANNTRPCSVMIQKKLNLIFICHSLQQKNWALKITMLQKLSLTEWFSSKFQSHVTIYHYINDRMKGIPNFVLVIGIWTNYKLVVMIVYVGLFIRSVIRKATPSDIPYYI